MFRRFLLSLLIPVALFLLTVRADDQDSKSQPKPKSPQDAAFEQERLADQFHNFENALLHLAQRLERSNKPEDRERAALLKEAIKKASEQNIDMKFKSLVTLLQSSKAFNLNEVKEAMDQSKMLADDIRAVLALLMSDNRDALLAAEKARIQQLIKQLNKVIREQKIARAQTETGQAEKDSLKKGQERIRKDTENIAKSMSKNKDGDSKDSKEGSKSKGKDGDKKDSKEGDKSKGKDGDSKDSQGKDKSQEGDSGKQSSQDTPGRQQVQKAVKNQKQAEGNLDKDKKKDASKDQDEAIKNLEEARKRLEEILRQLREEETERLLAALQARCERMLAMQIEIYDGTVRVDQAIAQNPDKKASRNEEQRALQLSDREQEVVREANKAIQLLQAEGSAVAFPEVFTQVRDDMQHVARRLGKADVAAVTQTIEQDIIATLKEMIEALKKAQQNRNSPSNNANQQNNQNGNPSLIDIIAELKMIRSLQIRVNSRTLTYARQYQGEQANQPDIQKELADLAQRQLKIFGITNNIARGKNR
jgi:hypothetical protein